MPPPSQLAARVKCLQAAVAQLSPALGFDLAPDLFESLLLHAQPEAGADAFPLDTAAAPGAWVAYGCIARLAVSLPVQPITGYLTLSFCYQY